MLESSKKIRFLKKNFSNPEFWGIIYILELFERGDFFARRLL